MRHPTSFGTLPYPWQSAANFRPTFKHCGGQEGTDVSQTPISPLLPLQRFQLYKAGYKRRRKADKRMYDLERSRSGSDGEHYECGLDVTYCDECQEPLEVGQSGLCDDCQDAHEEGDDDQDEDRDPED